MRFLFRFSVCFLVFVAAAVGQTPSATPPFDVKLIGPNVWAAIDDEKGDSGANAGFIAGDDGVLVVDTFENEAAAQALLAQIRSFTRLPIKFVVNTHYHLDHVAGNRVFALQGATIIAEDNVPLWIHTENVKFFGDKIKPEERKMVANLKSPEITTSTGLTLYLGSRRVEILYKQGHTGGDSIVSIPDLGIVFCGDLFWNKTLPNLIDATTSEWIATLAQFTTQPTDYMTNSAQPRSVIFVPGHGDVGNMDDVKDFQDYLTWLRGAVQKAQDGGKQGDALVAAVLPEMKEKYGSWAFFQDFSRSNILDAAAEIKGVKRVPPPGKK